MIWPGTVIAHFPLKSGLPSERMIKETALETVVGVDDALQERPNIIYFEFQVLW